MMKVPKERRTTEKFKMKKASYLEDLSNSQLFTVTKKSLKSSELLNDEDRNVFKIVAKQSVHPAKSKLQRSWWKRQQIIQVHLAAAREREFFISQINIPEHVC